jgi:D-glycero-D-manno-heptose 1,7-bisphosphate phosphatase
VGVGSALAGTARPAVFLDRDGVLNEAVVIDGRPHPPESAADVIVRPETIDACQRLHDAGLLLVVVTNQPDIARGRQTWEGVEAINTELRRRLPLDDVRVCPHDDADGCRCRKPAPGLLVDGATAWNIDLGKSVMIGDRWRDVQAGKRAGCAVVLIKRDYAEGPALANADLIVSALHEAVPWIIRATNRSTDS